MAQTDLSAVALFPYYLTLNVNTVANEIILPDGCDQLEVENWHSSKDLYIGQNNQTNNEAWNTNYYFVIPAKQAKKISLSRGGARAKRIFLAASVNTIPVHIELVNQ